MNFPHLLTPGRIGVLGIRNRLVFPPIQNRMADEHAMATPEMAAYYAERAKNGVGLVIMQHSMCWPEARLPRGLGLWSDACIKPLAMVADAVHAHGAAIGIQLGGRGTRQDNGIGSVAPSAIRLSYEKEVPTPLSEEQIDYFTHCYGQAARRAREAGLDAVEIHGAHGKLISQFLSPYTNRRTDRFGGSVENRTRFPREIVNAVHKAAGDDFPVIFRLSVTDCFEGGLTLDEGKEQVRLLDAGGVDAFHISSGSQEFVWNTDHSYFFSKMVQVDLAAAIKGVTKKPIIAVSKISDAFMAEQVLAEGKADFVAMGRPLLADAELLPKSIAGKSGDVRRCIYCLNCTTWEKRPYLKERGIGCTVNPDLCRETVFPLVPVETPKHILVVGGGLAGMEAARVLALRGHTVDLHEKSSHLGGQWRVAAKADHKTDFKSLIPWLRQAMKSAGVRVHLDSPLTAEQIASLKPDHVVLATGAVPRGLPVPEPAHGGPTVVQGMDVIMDKAKVGARVVVVGGRYIGMEAAEKLARTGRHVSLVEAGELGQGTIARLRGVYRNRLVESNVFIFDHSPLLRLTCAGADVANNGSMLSLPADTIVLAIGTVPDNALQASLEALGVDCRAIGDCVRISDAQVAMSDGAEIGRLL